MKIDSYTCKTPNGPENKRKDEEWTTTISYDQNASCWDSKASGVMTEINGKAILTLVFEENEKQLADYFRTLAAMLKGMSW